MPEPTGDRFAVVVDPNHLKHGDVRQLPYRPLPCPTSVSLASFGEFLGHGGGASEARAARGDRGVTFR
jgi:hypothetical protein